MADDRRALRRPARRIDWRFWLLLPLLPAAWVLLAGLALGIYLTIGTGSPALGILCVLPFAVLARWLL